MSRRVILRDRFRLILSDPPWPEQPRKASLGLPTHERNFEVMTEEEIAGLPVPLLASPDCLLLLWSTWRHVPMAIRVMEAWGFQYKLGFPWIKGNLEKGTLHHTLAYWIFGVSEPILIGVRKKTRASPKENIPLGLVEELAGVMSPRLRPAARKPDSVKELGERMVPDGPWLEMFARPPHRPGWAVWGKEA